jgi:hypothetical protein
MLIESTHLTLECEIGSAGKSARPHLDDEHSRYTSTKLPAANALLFLRRTYRCRLLPSSELHENHASSVGSAMSSRLPAPVTVKFSKHLFGHVEKESRHGVVDVARFNDGGVLPIHAGHRM